jgi:hypothetical protein
MTVRVDTRYLVAFAALIILCGLAHELAHHLVGAILCGAFGVKTFNSFELAAPCANPDVAFVASVWAGPMLTYALMWLGWRRLRSPHPATRQLGFALIFANFAVQRVVFALLGGNDEQWVTVNLFGRDPVAFWLTNALIWAMVVPPTVAAWRALAPPHRLVTFLGFLLLPFGFVFLFAGLILEEWLLLHHHVLAAQVIGIPMLLIVTEVVCLALYVRYRRAIAGGRERGRSVSCPP